MFPLVTGDLALSIVKGPLEAIAGVVYGIVGGIVIWYIPNRASVSTQNSILETYP